MCIRDSFRGVQVRVFQRLWGFIWFKCVDYQKRKKSGMVTINPLSLKPPKMSEWAIYVGWTSRIRSPILNIVPCWALKGLKRWRVGAFFLARSWFSAHFPLKTRPENGCMWRKKNPGIITEQLVAGTGQFFAPEKLVRSSLMRQNHHINHLKTKTYWHMNVFTPELPTAPAGGVFIGLLIREARCLSSAKKIRRYGNLQWMNEWKN